LIVGHTPPSPEARAPPHEPTAPSWIGEPVAALPADDEPVVDVELVEGDALEDVAAAGAADVVEDVLLEPHAASATAAMTAQSIGGLFLKRRMSAPSLLLGKLLDTNAAWRRWRRRGIT
jgi:hypothetical protein